MALVSSASVHNRLVAQAAKQVLSPLGLRQKGRSRTWLDDPGWWLGVVEFQPSAWSRGTYLNVGAMWLWRRDKDDIYFALSHRIDDVRFVEYESDEQFLPDVREVAVRAAEEVTRLRGRIGGFMDVAHALWEDAEEWGSWAAFDAAVALGLAGEARRAASMFGRVVATDDDRDWWLAVREDAARLAEVVVSDPQAFCDEINGWIERYREGLRLPALAAPV